MRKDIIFFDLDGTLTDSMPGITKGVQYALRRYGIMEEDLNKLKPFVGPPLHESFMEYYGFSLEQGMEAIVVFREYYNVTGWKENAPYPGVRDLLECLQAAGLGLCVATSKPERTAKRVLEHFGLLPYFTFVGGADDDSTRVKKDDVIRYVMEECKYTEADKERILMVGDRHHDMEGAKKAGISAAGVLYGYGSLKELLTSGADWVAETPKELGERILAGDFR
ncbi:MAG: HAD family hydrolase [Lachnospiraceae bacterium]|nr:HAD family hydrolase [Lachnospiraceae bacterium]